MELQGFPSRNHKELYPDIIMCLIALQRKFTNHFESVEITGKSSKMVPVSDI